VNLIERQLAKFLSKPPTVRAAARIIVVATASVVVLGGILMRLVDHEEYANVWVGMWWAIQTVTTVGYGDVTPAALSGRIIASFVMLEGIAFLAIVTAAITSTFVAPATKQRQAGSDDEMTERPRVEKRFDERDRDRRLDRLEAALRTRGS
jgi:voltage-gated potassium channel Kch